MLEYQLLFSTFRSCLSEYIVHDVDDFTDKLSCYVLKTLSWTIFPDRSWIHHECKPLSHCITRPQPYHESKLWQWTMVIPWRCTTATLIHTGTIRIYPRCTSTEVLRLDHAYTTAEGHGCAERVNYISSMAGNQVCCKNATVVDYKYSKTLVHGSTVIMGYTGWTGYKWVNLFRISGQYWKRESQSPFLKKMNRY